MFPGFREFILSLRSLMLRCAAHAPARMECKSVLLSRGKSRFVPKPAMMSPRAEKALATRK